MREDPVEEAMFRPSLMAFWMLAFQTESMPHVFRTAKTGRGLPVDKKASFVILGARLDEDRVTTFELKCVAWVRVGGL